MKEERVRIKYSKIYPASLIGHLDTIVSLQRSMRMATWPLKFTLGYNPRVKLSCLPPLSLGFTSEAEYMDVSLMNRMADYQVKKFIESTIKGIIVDEVRHLNYEECGINEKVLGFRYRIGLPGSEISRYEKMENVVETGKDFIILEVFKKNGNFRNPLKLLGPGKFKVKKIAAIFDEAENEAENEAGKEKNRK
jgi:radical SAM-linked protein